MTTPIAIIGMSCKFPSGVESPSAFWQFLLDGRDGISTVPSDRWDLDCYATDDADEPGKIRMRRGGFVSGLDLFDPGFFGISPREATRMDPQQRWLLEKTYEAFDDAGVRLEDLRGSNTGVYIGQFMRDWEQLQSATLNRELLSAHSAAGLSMAVTANRISYAFDLMGPSLALDTACSSALVAMHVACTAIAAGEIDVAVVGACNILLRPEMTMAVEKAGLLSADGRCKTFDASADGYVRSEGAGVFILKSRVRALADGDRVRAWIRATASNQDGRTSGISLPNGEAQAQLFTRVLERAGLRPDQIQYAEAHGTGTAVGDPTEAGALGRVLRVGRPPERPCVIGSVKSNLGHAEACAAANGLMKTLLAMEHGTIPANLHLETLNPNIDTAALGLSIAREHTPWPDQPGEPRRAIVNSFGFGGSNATIIVEAPSPTDVAPETDTNTEPRIHNRQRVLLLSARSRAALDELAARYAKLLDDDDGPALDDICYTAACRRSRHPHRLAVAGTSRAAIAGLLDAAAHGETQTNIARGLVAATGPTPRLCFVFAGNGPQWPRMGAELHASEPVFRAAIDRCDDAFRALADISIRDILYVAPADERIHNTRIAQLAIFSVQVALAELLKSWGVEPDLVVGHSIGEAAAAHIAGALRFEDAVAVVHHRSRLHATLAGTGKMLAVALSADEVEELLARHAGAVSLAAINSPRFVALAGDEGALTEIARALDEREVFNRMLATEVPYHSAVMDPILPELRESLAAIEPLAPACPLYSTVHGEQTRAGDWSPSYWADNSREPVNFRHAIDNILADGDEPVVFVEISPHPVLAASIVQTAGTREPEPVVVPTLRRGRSGVEVLAQTLAQLFVAGIELPWSELVRGRQVALPAYPWQHQSYWCESDVSREVRLGHSEAVTALGGDRHPLLGRRLNSTAALWQAELGRGDVGYLDDHVVSGDPVYPAAAYIEMAIAAAREHQLAPVTALEGLEFGHILLLDGEARDIELALEPEGLGYQISSRARSNPGAEWTVHARGRVAETAPPVPVGEVDRAELRASVPDAMPPEMLYEFCREVGLEYGPRFRNVEQLWRREHAAVARVVLPASLAASDYALHPALLDGCFHTLLAALMPSEGEPAPGAILPVSVAHLRIHGELPRAVWCHSTISIDEPRRKVGDLRIYADDGRLLVEILAMEVTVLVRAGAAKLDPDHAFYARDWLELDNELTHVEPSGRWLILTDGRGCGAELDAGLRACGVSTILVEAGVTVMLEPHAERRSIRAHEPDDFVELIRTAGG
jgi:acyl transferase domain-containing protein